VDIKLAFIDAFHSVDEAAIDAAYENLEKNYPSDPDLPDFASELAKLYGFAAALNPSGMQREAHRADEILREFSPGGRFADRPAAGWKQIKHAQFLIAGGQDTAARMIYRNLAQNPDDSVFCMAINEVFSGTVLTSNDVAFWKKTIEERLPHMSRVPAGLKGHLAILRQWDSEGMHPRRLAIEAKARLKGLDYLLDTGETARGLEEMQKVKMLLDEYFTLLAEGKAPKEKPRSRGVRYLKLWLAVSELWLNNNQRGLDLVNELLLHTPQPDPGELSLQAELKFWQIIAEERVGAITAKEEEMRLIVLLNEGHSGPHLVCRIVKMLAQFADDRNDKTVSYAYYRDLARVLPNPALALWARKEQAAILPSVSEEKAVPAVTIVSNLFTTEDVVTTVKQSSRLSSGVAGGIRAFSNWQEPVYKTALDSLE